jgi:hypothetical protein
MDEYERWAYELHREGQRKIRQAKFALYVLLPLAFLIGLAGILWSRP